MLHEHYDIVVFTGAGISAESGIPTFRDAQGLWRNYQIEEVATPQAFAKNPALVLEFYNQRKRNAQHAKPNAAHLAIAQLQQHYRVLVVTQNIDTLHEQAGSEHVLHLHGRIDHKRQATGDVLPIPIGEALFDINDIGADGHPYRPHVVWFGEMPEHLYLAAHYLRSADKVLAVGSSLMVQPAASLLNRAISARERLLVAPEVRDVPYGYLHLKNTACESVPAICKRWLDEQGA